MYSSLLWILFSILFIFLAIIFYLRQKQLQKLSKKNNNLFLTTQEAITYIAKKANLSTDEQEKLKILLPLAGSNRLYMGFEDDEPAKKWLTNTQRALYHNTQFNNQLKDELVFAAYEIFRKIKVTKALLNPSITSIKDISNGQSLSIEIPGEQTPITGTLISTDLRTIQILVKIEYLDILTKLQKSNSTITVTFWKKMDAGYSFHSHIISLLTKNYSCILSLSHPTFIKRTNIRQYPRRECTIPCRFKVNIFHTEFDQETTKEKSGPITLGLINNLGPNGCTIVTHKAIPNDSTLVVDFPLFNETLHIKGILKKILIHDLSYILNIEFTDELSRNDMIKIYHFVFSDLDIIQY
ncbi:MAG: hypothetical protein ACRCVW_04715 [Brevinema sp.]